MARAQHSGDWGPTLIFRSESGRTEISKQAGGIFRIHVRNPQGGWSVDTLDISEIHELVRQLTEYA
jgi:hypothetical protein